jgi:uncharacterized membrane protein (DUF485 family)
MIKNLSNKLAETRQIFVWVSALLLAVILAGWAGDAFYHGEWLLAAIRFGAGIVVGVGGFIWFVVWSD